MTHSYSTWEDTGNTDENDDPIYDWKENDTSSLEIGTRGADWSLTNNPGDATNQESYTASINAEDGITLSHTWLEEDQENPGQYSSVLEEVNWGVNHIQLIDLTTGHRCELSIDNGQISIVDLDNQL